MNKIKITLLFFVITLTYNTLNAQEVKENNKKNVEIKSDSIPIDTLVKEPIIPKTLRESFRKDSSYELGGITVLGLKKYEEETVKVFTGLKVGQEIKLPGDKLTSAIKKLYQTKQFSSVEVYVSKLDGTTVYLEFVVQELPQLNNVTFSGIKQSKAKDLQEDAELKKGAMLTENLLVTTTNYFKKKYQEKGFLNTKVSLSTKPDTSNANTMNMLVHIDKGRKVKIKNITFEGDSAFSEKKLRKAMKNTKKAFKGRFWKSSKFIEADFKEDLENIVTVYSEKGHRDARVLGHELTWNDDNTINLNIKVEEGKKYIFGDIKFSGNTVYTDAQLQSILKLEKGDTYNGKVLKERTTGDGTPDSDDIYNRYQNNGYLFSRVNAVETRVNKDSIDVEIRIYEDQQTRIKNVTVNGNDRTNDHVIYREIRTRPGYLYRKADIIRTIREIGQLGFFDAEAISNGIDIQPNHTDKTVDINYTVAEKGSSQIELQGGYGGGSFIGTLGLSFNNFSTRNIFNKKAYRPLPMGDGQTLSLRLQKSRYYTTSSFSFSEPWLGGKKPKSLSFSVYNSKQFRYDYRTNRVDKNQRLNIVGATVGLGQVLQWPDDNFTLSQSLSYQLYDLKDYPISTFSFSTGQSNNLAYNISLGRKNAGPNPIFPRGGSEFSINGKFTFPYSLVNNKDYSKLDDQERYKWLEYYKASFKGKWYTAITKDLILMANAEFGYLGFYNKKVGASPFERYFVGGDGMAQYQLDGRETIRLRGYENGRISSIAGGTIYNKFELELRYPITLKPSASIYALGFLDAGNAYDGFDSYNPFKLKRSAGVGLRIFMPAFGLLGIDVAHGFDPLPGGTEKSGWRTHFIIGQQF